MVRNPGNALKLFFEMFNFKRGNSTVPQVLSGKKKARPTYAIRPSSLISTLRISNNELKKYKVAMLWLTEHFAKVTLCHCTTLVFEAFLKLGKLQCETNDNRNEVPLSSSKTIEIDCLLSILLTLSCLF